MSFGVEELYKVETEVMVEQIRSLNSGLREIVEGDLLGRKEQIFGDNLLIKLV